MIRQTEDVFRYWKRRHKAHLPLWALAVAATLGSFASDPAIAGGGSAELYTVPGSPSQSQTIQAGANSVAKPDLVARTVMMLTSAVTITAAPPLADLVPGGQVALSAMVTGSANKGVTWSLNPNIGTITSTGVYTAPSALTQDSTVTATAIAQADNTKTAPVPIRLHANGIYFTTNANGLQTVVFNGANYNFAYNEGLLTVVQILAPNASMVQYYDPVCAGTFTANSVTKNCSAGSDSFTLTVSYDAPFLDTIRARMVFTNKSATDTIGMAGVSTLGVQTPFVAGTPSAQAVDYTNPVVAVSYGTGQFATWTETPGPHITIVETCGWINVCKNSTQLTSIAPGQTVTASVLLRFGVDPAVSTLNLAPEAYAAFRTAYPPVVNWPDRRPIYAWFMSDHGHQSATNPRGYLNQPSMDVSNIPAFRASVLTTAQNIIAAIKSRPVQPQGIVVWDLEGQEFAQPTSYIGDPRVLSQGYSPEMDATADQMFALFRNAGLKVGVTLRPNYLQWGPLSSRPITCKSSAASPAFDDYYVAIDAAYQNRFYACLAPNTWTLAPAGNGWQSVYQPSQVQQVTTMLLAKVAYARSRWGTTLYYVDSTVWNGGAPITADIFRALQQAYPDSLFIPEESYMGTMAVAMPYATPGGSNPSPYAPPTWRYAYPNAAQVTNMSNCSASVACWNAQGYGAKFGIGQKTGDIAMYSVPSQLSASQLTTIETMILQARNEAGKVIVTDSTTGTAYSYTGTPATINPQYPVKMRVYFAASAASIASSPMFCENGGLVGTNSCTLNLAGLTTAQIRYYDFQGNLFLSETASPR